MLEHLWQTWAQGPAQALGYTLLHALWQGALVSLALALILRLGGVDDARTRYRLSLLALAGLLIWSGVTLYWYWPAWAAAPLSNGPVAAEQIITLGPAPLWAPAPETSWQQLAQAILPWLSLIWGLGVLALGLRWLGSLYYVHRLRTQKVRPLATVWHHRLQQLMLDLGIQRPVQLLESERVRSPLTLGHFKPVILLPAGIVAGLTPAQVEAILAHELAHIQRYDFLVNLLVSLAETIFFFHPAIWWLGQTIRESREHCCDDMAVSLCGDLRTYVTALADVQAHSLQAPGLTLAFAGRKQALLQRIKRLTG
ncbi:MAG: M56 family metallopeptidase, partial [Bacteroidetes bacterium]